MFTHVVLGLLRDGDLRHGYDLIREYGRRSSRPFSSGNVYRELARLAADGLIAQRRNPAGDDPRRVPYQITDAGRSVFDRWIVSPRTVEYEFDVWVMVIDRVPPEALEKLLERRQERLWLRAKLIAEEREDALRAGETHRGLTAALSLEARHLAAELEWLHELRHDLKAAGVVPQPQRPVVRTAGTGGPGDGDRGVLRLAGARRVARGH
jgi:DNA-binding PadR family transcriptional regulator